MNATISRESLLAPLLTLSNRNKKWIADRLYDNIGASRKARRQPHATDALYDSESGCFLNEETMQTIREAQAGAKMEELSDYDIEHFEEYVANL